ncbi:hypothetical protein TGPRC2_306920 [Toxoplasma gondii TgCatPRC2]|uniref:Uncharacterized protein n=1 Tax=Toxoplasma gondii TgCatPRC2 TaxID=1130821 RepID=A0A151H036_TOXGO|nr:hypothetical protein TGPRC2_306920 [Toxoplasma gondii TgCatPRC2]
MFEATEKGASGDSPQAGGSGEATTTASVDSTVEPSATDEKDTSKDNQTLSAASAPDTDSPDAKDRSTGRSDGQATPASSSPTPSDQNPKKVRAESPSKESRNNVGAPQPSESSSPEAASVPAAPSSDGPEPENSAAATAGAGGGESTLWSYFGWGDPWASKTPAAEEAPPGPDTGDGGESPRKSKDSSTVVRFQGVTSEDDNAASKRARPRKENSVDKMGFVDLVESLLLNHDPTGRPGRFIDTFSTSEFASERDSDLDSMVSTELKGSGPDDGLVWQMEDIMAFEDQLHAALSTRLEQEARHMESSLKKGLVELQAQLGDDDEIKMIHYEARMAGLDLIVGIDTPDDATVRRIDLSTLMNLSVSNYDESMSNSKQQTSVGVLPLPSETSFPFTPRRQGPPARGKGGTWGAGSGRSPLQQMQAELLRLGTTSSEESTSEDDSAEKRKTAKNSSPGANDNEGRSPAPSASSSTAST